MKQVPSVVVPLIATGIFDIIELIVFVFVEVVVVVVVFIASLRGWRATA
jgi:hypothetical protein